MQIIKEKKQEFKFKVELKRLDGSRTTVKHYKCFPVDLMEIIKCRMEKQEKPGSYLKFYISDYSIQYKGEWCDFAVRENGSIYIFLDQCYIRTISNVA